MPTPSYCTVAEFRAWAAARSTNVTGLTDTQISDALLLAEARLERLTARSWVQRSRTETRRSTENGTITLSRSPLVSLYTAPTGTVIVNRRDAVIAVPENSRSDEVSITYTHGWDATADDHTEAVETVQVLAADALFNKTGGLSARADRHLIGQDTVVWATIPKGRRTGLLEVDAFISVKRRKVVG